MSHVQPPYDGDVEEPAMVDVAAPDHAIYPVFLEDVDIPADELDPEVQHVVDTGEV